MRIGITGATGFLGHYLISHLLGQGHEVVAWCRDPILSQNADSGCEVDQVKGSVEWIQGRLGDDDATRALVHRCDAIVHAGLFQHGNGFIGGEGDAVDYMSTNVIGSVKLLEAAVDHGVQRFVFVSSGAVHDRIAQDHQLDEQHPLWPASLYGAYKASVETLILWKAAVLHASSNRDLRSSHTEGKIKVVWNDPRRCGWQERQSKRWQQVRARLRRCVRH